MLGIDNQDFSLCAENLFHYFVIADLIRGDLLSDIWLFSLKGFLMLRCSYNW